MSLYPLGNIIPIGDSKTWGVTDLPGGCAFRDTMWNGLLSTAGGAWVGSVIGEYPDNASCPLGGGALLGEGHSGFHCNDMQPQIASWYTNAGSPPKVILHAGTNDLIAIATSAPGWNIDKLYGDFARLLATLVGAVSSTTTIWVCNMDPMPSLFGEPFFYPFNDFIRSQVKQYQRQGVEMYLIDLFSAAIAYNSGGVHQSAAGYATTGTRMIAAMKTLQPAG
jgi:hypothetical protein